MSRATLYMNESLYEWVWMSHGRLSIWMSLYMNGYEWVMGESLYEWVSIWMSRVTLCMNESLYEWVWMSHGQLSIWMSLFYLGDSLYEWVSLWGRLSIWMSLYMNMYEWVIYVKCRPAHSWMIPIHEWVSFTNELGDSLYEWVWMSHSCKVTPGSFTNESHPWMNLIHEWVSLMNESCLTYEWPGDTLYHIQWHITESCLRNGWVMAHVM